MPKSARPLVPVIFACTAALFSSQLHALQDNAGSPPALTIEPNFGQGWVSQTQPIVLKLSRPIEPSEGRLAVFIGTTDVTQLVRVSGNQITYGPNTLPLAAGQHEIAVSLIADDGSWREISRLPLKVLTRRGYENVTFRPAVDLSNKGQVAHRDIPDTSAGSREYFQDVTLQGGVAAELLRGKFALRTQANLAGSSYVNEALRFGELGDDAPLVDLSSYRIDLQQGPLTFSAGHISLGSQRHLISGFGGRGGAVTLNLGKRASIQVAGLSGTSIVGWDNITGLEQDDHQMLATTLGIELVPSRPGALRIEGSFLDGSLQPFNSFNQGSIRSAEKSRGHAVRVVAATPRQRFVVDAGMTRSRFTPAPDEQLEAGVDVVPLSVDDRDAAYIETTFNLIQGKAISKTQQASVGLTYRYEQVDPLFRSVAVAAQPDVNRQGALLFATVGPVTMQLSHEWMHDNLEEIASILKTNSDQSTANLGINLSALLGSRRSAMAIPALTASYSRIHQQGELLPVNSGFSPSHVPDQVSSNLSADLLWQVKSVRFGYRWNLSDQDNRQVGRATSDFEGRSNAVLFGFTPHDRFDVALERSIEEQESKEVLRIDETQRSGVTLSWRFFRQLAIAGNLSRSDSEDDPRTTERSDYSSFVELSSGFRLWRNRPGQQQTSNRIFVRYSDRESSSFDNVFALSSDNEGYAITTGLNLSLF